MSFRVVTTPIGAPVELPKARTDRLDPALLEAIVPAPGIDTLRDRLRAPGALAVTTGQQPGLFTGPLYTLHKALSAAALARVLERRWRRPVVPVFWSAGDDHDFAEASHAFWLAADGSLASAALPPRPADAPLTPMYRQPLGAGVEEALERLAADLPPSAQRDATLEWLRRHYRPQATVAASFAGALAELLAPAGVVVLDSTHTAVKRATADRLVEALRHARELQADLGRVAGALEAEGRDPGVDVRDGATLVMLEGTLGRDRLIVEDGSFLTRRSRERLDLPALERIAATEPARLSPNVLLRPVLESALLPTVAYLGGPGELRYLALTPPVYDRLGVPRQLPLPRWSGVLVEARVQRVLEKFGIELGELLEPAGQLEARLVRSQLPPEGTLALAALRAALETGYEAVGRSAVEVDPTLGRTVQGAKHQALAGVGEVEKKLVQALKRRQETELAQIGRARTAVLPGGRPQERVLTVAPFLARYGPELLGPLGAEMERWYAAALEGRRDPA